MPGDGLSRRSLLRLGVSSIGLAVIGACGPAGPAAAPPVVPTPTPVKPASAPVQPTSAPARPTAAPATPATQAEAKPTAVGGLTPVAQPRPGGLLRTAIPSDITRLDGHIDGGGTRTTFTQNLGLAFDQLVYYDAQRQPHAMLAESWDVSPDFKQVKLNLRKGVQWHSGRDFTSDDVKWNLLRGRDPKAGVGTYVNQSKWFQSIDTPDKFTVVCAYASSSRPRAIT